MSCTCFQNPPCSWCVDMPLEVLKLKDKIGAKQCEFDILTAELKELPEGTQMEQKWNRRALLSRELSELRKLNNY